MRKRKRGSWTRVCRTPLPEMEEKRQNRNKGTMTNDIFQQACQSVGVQPTKRQASKWNNKKGLAYKYQHNLIGG